MMHSIVWLFYIPDLLLIYEWLLLLFSTYIYMEHRWSFNIEIKVDSCMPPRNAMAHKKSWCVQRNEVISGALESLLAVIASCVDRKESEMTGWAPLALQYGHFTRFRRFLKSIVSGSRISDDLHWLNVERWTRITIEPAGQGCQMFRSSRGRPRSVHRGKRAIKKHHLFVSRKPNHLKIDGWGEWPLIHNKSLTYLFRLVILAFILSFAG